MPIYSDQMVYLLKTLCEKQRGTTTWGKFITSVFIDITGFSEDDLKRALGQRTPRKWTRSVTEEFYKNLANALWAASTVGNAHSPKGVLSIVQEYLCKNKVDDDLLNRIKQLSDEINNDTWSNWDLKIAGRRDEFRNANEQHIPKFFEAINEIVGICVIDCSPNPGGAKGESGNSLPTFVYPVLTGQGWTICSSNGEVVMIWESGKQGMVCAGLNSCPEMLGRLIPKEIILSYAKAMNIDKDAAIQNIADAGQCNEMVLARQWEGTNSWLFRTMVAEFYNLIGKDNPELLNQRITKMHAALAKVISGSCDTITAINIYANGNWVKQLAATFLSTLIGPGRHRTIRELLERSARAGE